MKMNVVHKWIFALVGVSSVSPAFADRIADYLKNPEDKKLIIRRCVNAPVIPEKCSRMNRAALDSQCITQEEYDTAVKENFVPICSAFGSDDGKPELLSLCPCGCFHPDVGIFATQKDAGDPFEIRAADLAKAPLDYDLVSLNPSTRARNFVLEHTAIRRVTSGAETKPLVVIEAANGKILKLTEQHAVLRGDGRMVVAKNISIGDRLVGIDGGLVAVIRVGREAYGGQVYNFLTDGREAVSHVLFAEGLAVGDLAWQNSLQGELNAVLIRE